MSLKLYLLIYTMHWSLINNYLIIHVDDLDSFNDFNNTFRFDDYLSQIESFGFNP